MLKAARVGAEQFIRMTFSSSNARMVYETYKNDSLFPEDIAAASGHDSIAKFLATQTKRFVNYFVTIWSAEHLLDGH